MELRVQISERYLKLAATTLSLVTTDDVFEDKVNEAVEKCKDAVVELSLEEDFNKTDAKQLAVALAMYALGKHLSDTEDEEPAPANKPRTLANRLKEMQKECERLLKKKNA